MTLIVEDGTGLANAESYVSVADATTYHANIGNTAWAAITSDATKEQLATANKMIIDELWNNLSVSEFGKDYLKYIVE